MLLLPCLLLLAACGQQAPAATPTLPPGVVAFEPDPELQGIRTYLVEKVTVLKQSTTALKTTSDRYFDIVEVDPAAAQTAALVEQARGQWLETSASYEQVKGIVAGVSHIAMYDNILDAGASEAEGGSLIAPIDVALPDGTALVKPGNLLALSRRTLWTDDQQPDANVLKGSADALDRYAGELLRASQEWQPSEPDAFTALVLMTPIIRDDFALWKNSLAAAGDASPVSRLTDIGHNIASLLVIHDALSERIQEADPNANAQIGQGLNDLRAFVADAQRKEQAGQQFTAEEADFLATEVENRVTAITGQVTQVMAQLGVPLETGTGSCTGVVPMGTPTP